MEQTQTRYVPGEFMIKAWYPHADRDADDALALAVALEAAALIHQTGDTKAATRLIADASNAHGWSSGRFWRTQIAVAFPWHVWRADPRLALLQLAIVVGGIGLGVYNIFKFVGGLIYG